MVKLDPNYYVLTVFAGSKNMVCAEYVQRHTWSNAWWWKGIMSELRWWIERKKRRKQKRKRKRVKKSSREKESAMLHNEMRIRSREGKDRRSKAQREPKCFYLREPARKHLHNNVIFFQFIH